VTRTLSELRPHPICVRHALSVSLDRVNALAALGAEAFFQPIIVTTSGILIDGYARYELAHRQGRQTIRCLEYDLDERESLRKLIQCHLPSKGLNGFNRSLLALEFEPFLQDAARTNQRLGGEIKRSSNLTEAQKVDVRSAMAAIACVSSGNIRKARVVKSADPALQQAVRAGEISVHKAAQWSRLSPDQQRKSLEEFLSRKGTNQKSSRLIQKHVARMSPTQPISPTLGEFLKALLSNIAPVLDSIVACEIDAPGQVAYFTKGAVQALKLAARPG
jgi:ParB-like chromosome segregation protein Spo0J